jgi:RNA polymerase sigma-70 factor (ECF subfamily)
MIPPDTSVGLLERLRREQFDQEAWEEFVRRYGRVLIDWARRWGAGKSDANDLAQEVLLNLLRQMRGFHYDPAQSFRGWLKTVAYRTLSHQRQKSQRCVAPGGSRHAALIDSIEARENLQQILQREAELELFELAAQRVRHRVNPHTWEAFELTAVVGLSGEEASARLDMSLSAVYVARFNVQKMLREEIAMLGYD